MGPWHIDKCLMHVSLLNGAQLIGVVLFVNVNYNVRAVFTHTTEGHEKSWARNSHGYDLWSLTLGLLGNQF